MNIKRMALVADSKGKIQPGNDTASIEELLVDNDALEEGISEGSLDSLRNAMQRLLSADKGTFCVGAVKCYMSPVKRLIFQKRNREPCPYCRGQRRKLNHFVIRTDE